MAENKNGVVLLHGIFRTQRNMAKLARFMEENGYRTLNLGYPSTRLSIGDIAAHIHPRVRDFRASVPGRTHFIGFSMGALVVRAYLRRFRPANLGRVVYLIGKPSDGKVSIESTRLDGMKDHVVIPACHTFFPSHREAWRQTLHFLEQGGFARN